MSKQIHEAMGEGSAVIHGNVPSKSNCYKIGMINGRAMMYKSKALKQYEKDFYIQCSIRGLMLEGWLEFEIDVYYPSNRSDLDNSLKVVLDCLEKSSVFKNDNKVVRIQARKFVDKKNPRCEFRIKTVD
jgi:Holliday junction resolvase RusA-like endonuclease